MPEDSPWSGRSAEPVSSRWAVVERRRGMAGLPSPPSMSRWSFAVYVSLIITRREFSLAARRIMPRAFRKPTGLEAITGGATARWAVTYIHGVRRAAASSSIIGWQLITTAPSCVRFCAAALAAATSVVAAGTPAYRRSTPPPACSGAKRLRRPRRPHQSISPGDGLEHSGTAAQFRPRRRRSGGHHITGLAIPQERAATRQLL